MNRWWAVLFLLGMGSISCATRGRGGACPPIRAGQYHPLGIGNRWDYEENMLGQRGLRQVEILKKEGEFFVDNQGARLAEDAFGIRDDRRYLLREPIASGTKWTNVVSVSSVEHYRILQPPTQCQVPAGTFECCVEVEGINRIDQRSALVNHLTFAPGVGIVRISVFAETSGKRIPQTELVLTSYHLSTAAAPAVEKH